VFAVGVGLGVSVVLTRTSALPGSARPAVAPPPSAGASRVAVRHAPARRAAARQRGISLTELMIGLTIGLIVMAGIIGLFSGHLRSNNDLLRTTRLNNELRGAMDLIVRDLRRASYWGDSVAGVWYPNIPVLLSNPFFTVDTATAEEVTYRYDLDSNGVVGDNETYRIHRNATDGTIEMLSLDTSGAVTATTPITDADLTDITALTFTPVDRTATTTCLLAGAGAVSPTPPVIHIRQITVTLTGQLRSDATVSRTLTESVRLRNDWIEGSCPS
jgi:prepilin peptidase dependent protein B